MLRAATSIVLNIAEGSTGESDAEQARFLGWRFDPSLSSGHRCANDWPYQLIERTLGPVFANNASATSANQRSPVSW